MQSFLRAFIRKATSITLKLIVGEQCSFPDEPLKCFQDQMAGMATAVSRASIANNDQYTASSKTWFNQYPLTSKIIIMVCSSSIAVIVFRSLSLSKRSRAEKLDQRCAATQPSSDESLKQGLTLCGHSSLDSCPTCTPEAFTATKQSTCSDPFPTKRSMENSSHSATCDEQDIHDRDAHGQLKSTNTLDEHHPIPSPQVAGITSDRDLSCQNRSGLSNQQGLLVLATKTELPCKRDEDILSLPIAEDQQPPLAPKAKATEAPGLPHLQQDDAQPERRRVKSSVHADEDLMSFSRSPSPAQRPHGADSKAQKTLVKGMHASKWAVPSPSR